jgi:HlyD family secretion protein
MKIRNYDDVMQSSWQSKLKAWGQKIQDYFAAISEYFTSLLLEDIPLWWGDVRNTVSQFVSSIMRTENKTSSESKAKNDSKPAEKAKGAEGKQNGSTTPKKTAGSSAFKKKNKGKKRLITCSVIVVILLLLLLLGVLFFMNQGGDANAEFRTVEKKSITSTVAVTGSVTSANQKTLSFPSSGIIEDIQVEEGDQVTDGQFLAQLDTGSIEAQKMQAEGALITARANRNKAQKGLTIEIQEQSLRNAQLALENAQEDLNATLKTTENAVDKSELAVVDNQVRLANAQTSLRNTDKDSAQDVAIAEVQKENAEETFENTVDDVRDRTAGDTQRDTAEGNYDLAVEQKIKTELSRETQLDTAEGQVLEASTGQERALEDLDSTIADAANTALQKQNAVEQAESSVAIERARLNQEVGTRPDDLEALRGQILQAEGSIASAQESIDNAELYAPFMGTVVQVAYDEDEQYMGGSEFIALADLDQLQIEVDISETDIVEIEEGQRVEVTFDALDNEDFVGEVIKIDPGPTVVQGVVNYTVTVSFPKNPKIRLGMTANLDIITAETEETLVIPLRALERDDDGNPYVRVRRGEEIIEQPVEIGVDSGTEVQILEGVQEDDEVVI